MKRCPQCGYKEPKPMSRWRKRPIVRPTHVRMRNGHEYLNGLLAHVQRRLEIFRNAGGEAVLFTDSPCYVEEIKPATCQGCAEAHLVGWNEGEWHHNVKSKGGKRCDCAACGKYVCQRIHEVYRNRIIP